MHVKKLGTCLNLTIALGIDEGRDEHARPLYSHVPQFRPIILNFFFFTFFSLLEIYFFVRSIGRLGGVNSLRFFYFYFAIREIISSSMKRGGGIGCTIGGESGGGKLMYSPLFALPQDGWDTHITSTIP